MKGKLWVLMVFALIVCPCGVSLAASYSGQLTWAGGGLTATSVWANNSTSLSWTVDDVNAGTPGWWHYSYTLNVGSVGGVSHMIVEASNPFAAANLDNVLGGTPDIKTWTPGNENPLMPGNIYGVKFDISGDTTNATVSFDSDREPVWGDFYSKDGKHGGVFATVWNTGFLDADPTDPPADGTIDNKILRPDTGGVGAVPEPMVLTVLATLLGGALTARRIAAAKAA